MNYEIRPVKNIDGNYERCTPDDELAVWGLYKLTDGIAEHVADYSTKEDAEEFLAALVNAADDPRR